MGGNVSLATFNKTDFIIMALGNIIGSGIFLASSLVISIAGAWTPLAYLLGGLIMIMEVAFIIEMTIANPVHGSFKVYAQEVFGDWWGFLIGWMFWVSGVLGMASEVTACAIFMRLWIPNVPLWIGSLVFSLGITFLNFNDLKGLSKIELGLSITKVATLVVFVIIGFAVLLGMPIGNVTQVSRPIHELFQSPVEGLTGMLGAMLLILFAYTGTGIIGIAAVETKKPEQNVPPAARIVTVSIVILYTLSAYFIVSFLPIGLLDEKVSPFVQLFTIFKIPYAGDIVNFILLTAALSALNSQVYSSSRMLFSLAKDKQAPKIASYQNKKGVPVTAVAISGIVLLATAMLSYILPETIFIYTVSASGFLALINWMSVSATHYYYRKKIVATAPEKLKYKAPGYPYLSWLCFFLIFIAILSTPLYPDQLPGLYAGVIILVLISIVYYIRKSLHRKRDL
jgi:L-asparagine transporter-like permease